MTLLMNVGKLPGVLTFGGPPASSEVERLVPNSHATAAVVGPTVPVAVLAIPVGLLSMPWVGRPRRLRPTHTVLVVLNVREPLLAERR